MSTLLPLADIFTNFEDIGAKTGFTPPQFIAQCVAVTVLFLILQKFAWQPVRTILEQRRKAIEDSMASVEKIKTDAAEAEASRIKVIQKANDQANTIIAEAEKSAIFRAEQKLQEATKQAEDIVKKAHEAAVLDRNKLMEELKRDLSALVIQTSEKVVGRILTEADHERVNIETYRSLRAPAN